ncbi:MAG: type I-MYXAN CRISPR-associated protein Cas6/Cmx6 [bacterium]
MFWEEDEDKTIPYQAPDDVLDVSFAIQCKELPIDHAWALSQAIQAILPWFADEKVAGVHSIHVAETGNGWERPDDQEHETLRPSRRTKLLIRLPKNRLADVEALIGKSLSIQGYPLIVGKLQKKPLTQSTVIFARYVLSNMDESEPDFLKRIAQEVYDITGERIKKMMCGKSYTLHTPNGDLLTRHLMIADLKNDPSVKIQQIGLGGARTLGCGLFLPHKGIKSLNAST